MQRRTTLTVNVVAGLIACGPGLVLTTRRAEATAQTIEAAVQGYAPTVHLHPDDPYRPTNPSVFLAHSELLWHHKSGCAPDNGVSAPSAAELGSGGYTHRRMVDPSCQEHEGRAYHSNELTSPRDTRSVAEGDGFYLRLADQGVGRGEPFGPGQHNTAPAFFDVVSSGDTRWIVYWFFYGLDDDHQGDWEGISIRLDTDNRARQIVYRIHDRACSLATTGEQRPVVYSAKGKHASYPSPDTWSQDQISANGPIWETEGDLLTPLRAAVAANSGSPAPPGWYGYGGSWGDVGKIESWTGPLGPYPEFKTGVPPDPDRVPRCRVR